MIELVRLHGTDLKLLKSEESFSCTENIYVLILYIGTKEQAEVLFAVPSVTKGRTIQMPRLLLLPVRLILNMKPADL